jgi:non-heme chloroperoxidase
VRSWPSHSGALRVQPPRRALVMQGDDDQIVPYKDAVLLQAKLIKDSTLKVYPAYPHGMLSVHADVINADLLAFIKS